MKKIKLQLKLKWSMVHTEWTNSNIANIYRERMLIDNEIHTIPALHGNSLRWQLRNLGADHYLTTLWVERWSAKLNFFHVLFSGGALEQMTQVLDIKYKKQVRAMCPFLSLFGSAMGNEMLKGKMMVSSLLPQCKELGTGDISYWDMTSIVRYTRQDDAKWEHGDKRLKAEQEPKKQQMFYDIEVLNAGNILEWSIYLDTDDEIEIGAFHAMMRERQRKPFIGWVSRVGHGEVEVLTPIDTSLADKYEQYLLSNKDQILEWVTQQG